MSRRSSRTKPDPPPDPRRFPIVVSIIVLIVVGENEKTMIATTIGTMIATTIDGFNSCSISPASDFAANSGYSGKKERLTITATIADNEYELPYSNPFSRAMRSACAKHGQPNFPMFSDKGKDYGKDKEASVCPSHFTESKPECLAVAPFQMRRYRQWRQVSGATGESASCHPNPSRHTSMAN